MSDLSEMTSDHFNENEAFLSFGAETARRLIILYLSLVASLFIVC